MLDQRRMAAQPDEKREQLFTERYEGLLAWAMRLTNQQRDAAEDLVQDAFVQFVLGRTRLEEIENIDGYLRKMLRYMHVSRLSRSAQHLQEAVFSIADYDSCRHGWSAIEPPRRMQAFEELHQICAYACARKESSRAGSVLILRFFHEYLPTEIAAVLNSSRHCVDQWQGLARREVKLLMNEPGRLRFVNAVKPADRTQIRYLRADCDLMLELRQMIFNSRQGDCLSQAELAEIYGGGNADALTTVKLAHIVSCPACLDAVNGLLGLPLLAQRYRSEPSKPEEPPQPRQALSWLIVLVCVVVIAGFLLFKASLSRPLSASGLLEKASVAEKSVGETPNHVRHRFINLEERRSAEGAIVAQHKIEIWEDPDRGARTRRLYDHSNRLIGGTWQRADGSRTVYHHGSKPQSQPTTTPGNLLLNLEDVWQLELSAQSFAALIEQPTLVKVEERSTTYVLHYVAGRTIGASHLLKATLTLSKSDLHAVEQTLVVQRGGVLREYRFVEASFELLPLKNVAPGAFEIEPELTGGDGEPGGPGERALRDLSPPATSTSTPPIASAELEVDVAYLLNRAKADRTEQVNLTRSAGGSLRVEGVVDTQQRKDEFLRVLAPVSNNPAVKIEIRTVAETLKSQPSGGAVIVEEALETTGKIAADKDLRAYFEKREPNGPAGEAIRSYSSRMVNHAHRALFHVIELKQLINRFAKVDMRTVAPDARAKFLAMIHEHAVAFERENAVLRQEIGPVFFPEQALTSAEELSIQSDADLARAVERLHKLTLSNTDAIRSALTISSQPSAAAIRSTAFWQSIQRVESLAKRIQRYQVE